MTSELSPARQRLAELQQSKDGALAEMSELQKQQDRLACIVNAAGPARGDLVAFDQQHAASLSRWARGEEPVQPRADSKKRAALAAALAQAELDAEAAAIAQAELAAASDLVGQKVRHAHAEAERLAKVVIVDEMRRLLPQVREARAVADVLAAKFAAARAEIMRGIPFGSTAFGEAQSELERFEKELREAETPAAIAPQADWRRFTSALLGDAAISFEDASRSSYSLCQRSRQHLITRPRKLAASNRLTRRQ